MTTKEQAVIDSLADALKEALIWLCIEGKEPPYRVPYAIQGDLSKHTEVMDKAEAYKIISEAVKKASQVSEEGSPRK